MIFGIFRRIFVYLGSCKNKLKAIREWGGMVGIVIGGLLDLDISGWDSL